MLLLEDRSYTELNPIAWPVHINPQLILLSIGANDTRDLYYSRLARKSLMKAQDAGLRIALKNHLDVISAGPC